MKYKLELLDIFNDLKLKPRPHQLEYCDKILETFLDKKIKNVVLSAPTGSGKSIIAAVVGRYLYDITKKKNVYLSHTNVLSKQYQQTFDKYADFDIMMGANNYECAIMNDNAEQCINRKMTTETFAGFDFAKCEKCAFRKMKINTRTIPQLITNYSIYFISSLITGILGPRGLVVFDEAHTINETFVNHVRMHVSVRQLNSIINFMENEPAEEKTQTRVFIDHMIKHLHILERFTKDTKEDLVKKVILSLYDTYSILHDIYNRKVNNYRDVANMHKYKAYLKFANRLSRFNEAYNLYNQSQYEHVVDSNQGEASLSPIFISKFFKDIDTGDYNLFMSATIDGDYISSTLNIDNVATLKMPSSFEPDSKSIVMMNHKVYNYKTMNDWNTIKQMNNMVTDIVMNHQSDNGIILTPSFKINRLIGQWLQKNYRMTHRIFEHIPGEKLEHILDRFKEYNGKSILISPSLFEGVDLPGELSKFQIMIKAPYPSLADRRMLYISNHHQKIYTKLTLYKIIQGFGRSTRFDNDKSITYCLDSKISDLFGSKQNLWFDEFNLI